MNCTHTPVFINNCPGKDFFLHFQDKILFGSDFPNIPYKYSNQIDSIKNLKLGDEFEQKVFGANALKLLSL